MSATNTTTNYSLPIFIGSDKPAWLVDFNGAMNAIDAQMKVNADAIASKSPILTFNDTTDIDFTRTGDVITANLASGVSDKVGRALVKPLSAPAADQIVGIDTNGDQAAIEIGSGLFNDNGTLKAIDLNLSNIQSTTSLPPGITGLTHLGGSITLAKNSDGSAGKIYGAPYFRNSTTSMQTVSIPTGLKVQGTGTAYSISPAGIALKSGTYSGGATHIEISATGDISIRLNIYASGDTYANFFPCIYFFKDFGDQPI